MRRYQPLLIFWAFILAFLVILIPLLKENLGQVKAENLIFPLPSETSSSATQEANESGTSQAKVDYYLPYPGILPDHPLYWLKMIRDRVSLALTKEPQKRFAKLLLYADKRLGAAEALIKGRQFSLGVTTASKAEIYLERAIAQFEILQKENKATAILKDQIQKAVSKHQEVLWALEKEMTEERGTLTSLREKTERLKEKLQQILNK